jgi:DNA-binding transcriptional LysR family regulator
MGEAMLANARQAVFHADQCRQAVADASQGLGGMLRLGFIGSATYALLPGLIASLGEHLPKVELELTEGTTAEILDRLVARQLDVGLVRYPLLDPGPFELTPLDKDTFVLAVAQQNPLATRDSIALSDAAHEPFIMYPRDKVPGLCALAMLRCELSGFTPQVVQEAMQVQTIMSLVASGLGVGLVAGVAQRAAPAGVKCLPLTDTPAGFHVGIALVRMADNASRLTQRFIEHALHFTSSNSSAAPQSIDPRHLPR